MIVCKNWLQRIVTTIRSIEIEGNIIENVKWTHICSSALCNGYFLQVHRFCCGGPWGSVLLSIPRLHRQNRQIFRESALLAKGRFIYNVSMTSSPPVEYVMSWKPGKPGLWRSKQCFPRPAFSIYSQLSLSRSCGDFFLQVQITRSAN